MLHLGGVVAYSIPEPMRSAVGILADLILPFEDWVREPNKFRPSGELPWRSAATAAQALNATGLQFVGTLEGWIDKIGRAHV